MEGLDITIEKNESNKNSYSDLKTVGPVSLCLKNDLGFSNQNSRF